MLQRKDFIFVTTIFMVLSIESVDVKLGTQKKQDETKKMRRSIRAKKEHQKRAQEKSWMTNIPLIGKWFENPKQTLSTMPYERLRDGKNQYIAVGDPDTAIKYIEKMLPLCDDLNELRQLMLELADLTFEKKAYVAAEKLYSDFVTFYPGDEKVWYALRKAILCCYNTILEPDRDQSITKRAIELCNQYLEKAETLKNKTDEIVTNINLVNEIKEKCTLRVVEHEIGIFNFYKQQCRYTSAQKRLELLITDYLDDFPELEPRLLQLDFELAQQKNDPEQIEEKRKVLEEKYPKLLLAQNEPKKSMARRF